MCLSSLFLLKINKNSYSIWFHNSLLIQIHPLITEPLVCRHSECLHIYIYIYIYLHYEINYFSSLLSLLQGLSHTRQSFYLLFTSPFIKMLHQRFPQSCVRITVSGVQGPCSAHLYGKLSEWIKLKSPVCKPWAQTIELSLWPELMNLS